MTKLEIQQKIQDLVDSGQGENVYIAIYMMVNQLDISLEEAFKQLKPIDYERNYTNPNDFYCSIRIANIWIEYESIEGYVPYMGTAATTSRVVSYYENEQLASIEGLSEFLPIDDDATTDDIRGFILEDYHSLIPTVIRLLED